MTKSTITRERLEALANAEYCKSNPGAWLLGLKEVNELARMALAAMDSEYHTDDELSNLLWYSQEATCHSDPNYYCEFQRLATPGLIAGIIRELQERRKADGEPVAIIDQANLDYLLSGADADVWPPEREEMGDVLLYRHAQPAPVVEREPIAWLNDAYLARGVVDGEAGSEDAGPGYIPVYREAGPQPASVIPGKWIPVSERMPEDRTQVILWDAEIGEVTSGHYSHKTQTFYHCGDAIENEITHWMLPPSAPQGVKP